MCVYVCVSKYIIIIWNRLCKLEHAVVEETGKEGHMVTSLFVSSPGKKIFPSKGFIVKLSETESV